MYISIYNEKKGVVKTDDLETEREKLDGGDAIYRRRSRFALVSRDKAIVKRSVMKSQTPLQYSF